MSNERLARGELAAELGELTRLALGRKLGRKMAIVQHSAAAAAARAVVEEYLRKYPDATYFSAARAILKSP